MVIGIKISIIKSYRGSGKELNQELNQLPKLAFEHDNQILKNWLEIRS